MVRRYYTISPMVLGMALLLPAAASAKTVTLQFVCNDPPELRAGAYERAIKAFEASHPNIKIKYTLANSQDFITYLITRAAGGAMPDIFYHRCQYTDTFASRGLIRPLDSYIKRDKLDLRDLWTAQLDELKWNGKFYALPENYSSWGVTYNVEMAKEAGVIIPNTPWTWDELRAAAAKLSKRDGNKVLRYGFQYNYWDVWAMLGLFYGKSGKIYSPDFKSSTIAAPENVKLLQMFSDMSDQGQIPPYGAGDFAGKKVAMSFDGSWCADIWRTQLKGAHFNVAYAPTGDFTKRPSVGNSGAGYVISKTSKNPDAAWEFIKFLTSEDTLDDLVVTKLVNIPARKSTAERFVKKIQATGDPKDVRIWLDSAERGWSIPSTPYHDDLIKSLRNGLQPYFSKKKSAEAVLQEIEKEVNTTIKRRLKK